MKQAYREQPPTDCQHRMSDVRGTAVDHEVNEEQKTEKSGADQRSPNDLRPV